MHKVVVTVAENGQLNGTAASVVSSDVGWETNSVVAKFTLYLVTGPRAVLIVVAVLGDGPGAALRLSGSGGLIVFPLGMCSPRGTCTGGGG